MVSVSNYAIYVKLGLSSLCGYSETMVATSVNVSACMCGF